MDAFDDTSLVEVTTDDGLAALIEGAILVAAQGTMGDNELYGRCQFSHRNFENRMITQHILRIIPDSDRVNPGYLFAFLSSEYGFH